MKTAMMKKTLQSTATSQVGKGQAMSRRHWNAQRRLIVAPMHATHNITILPGDGIGPEIMSVALEILREAGKKEGETFYVITKPARRRVVIRRRVKRKK